MHAFHRSIAVLLQTMTTLFLVISFVFERWRGLHLARVHFAAAFMSPLSRVDA